MVYLKFSNDGNAKYKKIDLNPQINYKGFKPILLTFQRGKLLITDVQIVAIFADFYVISLCELLINIKDI